MAQEQQRAPGAPHRRLVTEVLERAGASYTEGGRRQKNIELRPTLTYRTEC